MHLHRHAVAERRALWGFAGRDREESRNEEEMEEEERGAVRMQSRQAGAQVSDASNNIFMPCS